jgi:hypothetical protein
MVISSWPSGHYLAVLLAGFIVALMAYLVVLSHLWSRP